MTSRQKTTLAVLRSILGPVSGGEIQLSKRTGLSRSWIVKASAGFCPMTKPAAARIADATGVSFQWLLKNDVARPAVGDGGEPFTVESFQRWQELDGSARRQAAGGHKQLAVLDLHSLLLSLHAAEKAGQEGAAAFALSEFASMMSERFGESESKAAARFAGGLCGKLAEQIEGAASYTGPEIKLLPKTAKPSSPARPVSVRRAGRQTKRKRPVR